MDEPIPEAVRDALRKAFRYGEMYWQQPAAVDEACAHCVDGTVPMTFDRPCAHCRGTGPRNRERLQRGSVDRSSLHRSQRPVDDPDRVDSPT